MQLKNVIMEYSNLTYNELNNKRNDLLFEKNILLDKCAKENKTYDEYVKLATPLMTDLYLIEQEIRLKQIPTMEYGKTWKGIKYTLSEFIENCYNNICNDKYGNGYYATENSKSDIKIYSSDIIDNKYRKDFTHIIWFNTNEL